MPDNRTTLLEHVLPLVPFDGWSEHALSAAAKHAGLNDAELKRAFPAGPADCIDYFFTSEDDALIATHPAAELAQLRVPDRIETLILTRLSRLARNKEAVRRAVAQRAMPWNAVRAVQSLYRTVDVMWKLAGDASTDFNFYTKRATLAAIYSATLLFWLNDDSVEIENTKQFLKRRLAELAAFGKSKKAFKQKFKVG